MLYGCIVIEHKKKQLDRFPLYGDVMRDITKSQDLDEHI